MQFTSCIKIHSQTVQEQTYSFSIGNEGLNSVAMVMEIHW